MFDRAWKDYLTITKNIKHLPGKDQNKLADAMRYAKNRLGLHWKYFADGRAVLVDKIYKFENQTVELGGEVGFICLRNLFCAATNSKFPFLSTLRRR